MKKKNFSRNGLINIDAFIIGFANDLIVIVAFSFLEKEVRSQGHATTKGAQSAICKIMIKTLVP